MKHLNSISVPFALCNESANALQSLNLDIGVFNGATDELAKRTEELHAVGEADWSPAHATSADRLRGRRLELLKSEIALRTRIDEFLALVNGPDRQAAVSVAYSALEGAQDDVRARLVSIGYIDGELPNMNGRAGIQPVFIASHPDVIGAKAAHDSVSDYDSRPQRAENAASLDKCRQRLAGLRAKSLAAIS
jgi:hypothetical protein